MYYSHTLPTYERPRKTVLSASGEFGPFFKPYYQGEKRFVTEAACLEFYAEKIQAFGACKAIMGGTDAAWKKAGCPAYVIPSTESKWAPAAKRSAQATRFYTLNAPCIGSISKACHRWVNSNWFRTVNKAKKGTLQKGSKEWRTMKKWKRHGRWNKKVRSYNTWCQSHDCECDDAINHSIRFSHDGFMTITIRGKAFNGDHCKAEYGARLLGCKSCCCERGLVVYNTKSRDLSLNAGCADWYQRAIQLGSMHFSLLRMQKLFAEVKRCPKAKCISTKNGLLPSMQSQ